MEDLPAAERQQLSGQRGGAIGSVPDLLHDFAVWGIWLEQTLEVLAKAGDDRQQVVEVVSDAARQSPNRVHLLGLAELFF